MVARAETARYSFRGQSLTRWVGILGIAIGVVAFWLALPPLTTRTEIWPLAVGIFAVALYALSRSFRALDRPADVIDTSRPLPDEDES